jgi:peptidoglycan hydrolase-like protein with peptidoglycan-binding domain
MKFSDILILEETNINPKNLKFGDRGDDVKKLQQLLMDKGLLKTTSMKPTGYFGKLTRAALDKAKGVKNTSVVSKQVTSKQVEPKKAETQRNTVVLVGGLNYRSGDKSTSEQASMLSNAIGMSVKGFDYNAADGTILAFMKANQGAPIFLFSAGCNKALMLSKSEYVDKSSLFIIEPYATSANVRAIVSGAVNNGVPASHVFVGGNSSRGLGAVSGASKSNAKSHWDAIASVGKMVM